uniref:Uncharacterized protein n=1 Tax=Picea sitchensis TaxID=3332 RepID=A9NQK8_PICSI|nr:unknown [Picea sitchensis]
MHHVGYIPIRMLENRIFFSLLYESADLVRIVSMGNKIAQVVCFRKIMSKFQRLANARKAVRYAFSAKKKRMLYFGGDCNEYELIDTSLPMDVPKGHFSVYVGSERSRFIVPTSYLNHPLFQSLLEKAKEVYGFHQHMGLTIPCEKEAFEYITSVLEKKDSTVANMLLEEIMELI